MPNYKEANPALFTIVSFPFLFGVMFGDAGHGGLLFLLGATVCFFSEYPAFKTGMLKGLRDIRYLILLMGFFAFFCGLLYNDFMAIPMEVFKSCWKAPKSYDDDTDITFEPRKDCVYPFGMDHAWYRSTNNLVFFNSMKMKISVIFGVAQMCLGIFLKASNAIYFKKPIDFIFEFLPQITLMLCLFGYMSFLIILKWITPWPNTSEAPSIIGFMIDMFL